MYYITARARVTHEIQKTKLNKTKTFVNPQKTTMLNLTLNIIITNNNNISMNKFNF